MKNPADPPGNSPNDAHAHLVRLNAQVTAMRAVLVQLLQEIVVAETRLENSQANLLMQANEQLIVSALDSQADAETAHGALDEASRVGGLDALTGLPNRAVLLDRFETAIVNAKRHGNRVALLFLDLDAFKQINDTFGHGSGDKALQWVAGCLASLVRESDTVSRHGGDEFLILLSEVTDQSDALLVAEKVNAALAAQSRLDGQQVSLRASIGVSIYPEDGEDAKTLIARADASMYLAKQQGSGAAVLRRDEPLAPTPQPRQASANELALIELEQGQKDLREANENLVLAALGAQELLAAAEQSRRRQSELLAMIVDELSNPFAPIRVAASTLGLPGAEATLLPRVQALIEQQAEKLARMVMQALEQQGRDKA